MIAQLLEDRGVVVDDVPLATKIFLLGFHLGRNTPPWSRQELVTAVDLFFR